MEWAVGAILKENLKGRKVVVWGTGKSSYDLSSVVEREAAIEFYISRDATLQPFFLEKPVYPPLPCR